MPAKSDFLSRLGVSDNLRLIIQRSAREYDETGEFVSFDTLAYERADTGIQYESNEVFSMPQVLGGVWTTERVDLTGLGLVEAGTAPRTTQMMATLAGICGQRKLTLRDEAKISRRVLVSEYGFSEEDAIRSCELVQKLPGVSGGGNLGEDWSLSVFRTALEYRQVQSVDDLRCILEGFAEERMGLQRQTMETFQQRTDPAFGSDAVQVQVLAVDEVRVLEGLLGRIRKATDENELEGLDDEVQLEVDAEVRTLDAQLHSPKPKRSIVRGALDSLRIILQQAVGTAAGGALLFAVEEAIRHIQG